ncbi:PREDICTED: uncharacterized protein LOC109215809 [Nicotiana attenuata]|uniref:uncharacterized protein LOC109215809 n=1 Tax=Nicotiana attenuata TaxID=49451 RepID=UPI0009053757|nr:PREDICTED: uncharacterized protein LOC109215809 [Nicotiana attenuata]
MAGRQLGFPKTSGCNLKEQLVRRTLNNVRSQGHTYIELREDGKRLVFFCTLCHSPCYSDSVLFNHLKGSLHTEMVAAAKATLLKPNPWPFNDGVLFFKDPEHDKQHLPIANVGQSRLADTCLVDESSLAIVEYGGNSRPNGDVPDLEDEYCELTGNGQSDNLVIPGVLCKDELSDLEVNLIGIGQIAVRLTVHDIDSKSIRKIWCEWLGKNDSDDIDVSVVPDHDFAVVTFPYNYNLGRKALLDDRFLLPSSPYSESEETITIGAGNKRRRKSFSDPEDISESLSNQCDSSGEESQSTNSSNMRLILGTRDDQLVGSRIISSKTMRRELRKQQRVASERMCDICQQKMLPGKDVAALLNRKSGRLVCSSRNLTGVNAALLCCFSHLISFLCTRALWCFIVVPIFLSFTVIESFGKKSGIYNTFRNLLKDVFQSRQLFDTHFQLSPFKIKLPSLLIPIANIINFDFQMFRYKIKLSDARKAWMKNPEVLPNCSTGFHLPPEHDDLSQEYVSPLKLLHFYRTNVSI